MFTAGKRTLLAALAVTAVAAPSTASARFMVNDPVSSTPATVQSVLGGTHPVQAIPSSSSTFEWGDAGIGAAAAVALIGAGTAALGGRRRRGHAARTT